MKKTRNTITAFILIFTTLIYSVFGQFRVVVYDEPHEKDDWISEEKIIFNAIELSNYWTDEYIDVDLKDSIKNEFSLTNAHQVKAQQEISDIALYETSIKIYNDLGEEDKVIFKELASSNKEIGELFSLITGEYENYEDSSNIALMTMTRLSTIQETTNILIAAGLSTTAVTTIKGAFSAMIAAIKLFLTPTIIKVAIAVAAILIITAVVVYNWKIIQPFFADIVDVFVSSAGAIGNSIRNVFDQIFSKVNRFTEKLIISSAIIASLAIPQLSNRVYYISYLSGNDLFINYAYALNYAEAYTVLVEAKIINVVSIAKFAVIALTQNLKNFAMNLRNKNINQRLAGVYTRREMDAAKLAYALGGYFNNGKTMINEIHDYRLGSGYYRHYHDLSHTIHVWYGNPV